MMFSLLLIIILSHLNFPFTFIKLSQSLLSNISYLISPIFLSFIFTFSLSFFLCNYFFFFLCGGLPYSLYYYSSVSLIASSAIAFLIFKNLLNLLFTFLSDIIYCFIVFFSSHFLTILITFQKMFISIF